MAVSTAQAQAALLQGGSLDFIGDQRDDIGVSLKETDSALLRVAAKFVQDCRDNLNPSDRTASGELEKSIVPVVVEFGNNINIIDINVLFYYKFVDAGVKGLRSGSSTKGYSFKTAFPSKNMVDNLEAYIKSEGLAITNTKVALSTRERKRKGMPIPESRKAAIRMGIAIKRKGLDTSNFWQDALTELERDIATGVADALKIDIIETF